MSGTKLCPKVILEGTRLTRKTDLAFALNEHPRLVGPRRYTDLKQGLPKIPTNILSARLSLAGRDDSLLRAGPFVELGGFKQPGGKTVLGRITKRGDGYLRRLVIFGARSALAHAGSGSE